MEIDGHCYVHGVTKIEIEKVRGKYLEFIRIKIRGTGDTISLTCWGPPAEGEFRPQQPEVIITELDEREPADAIDEHSEESDR